MDDWEEYFEWYVEGVLLFIIGLFGVIGNIVFIIIFSCRRQDINTFHSLMVCLSYFNIVYLTSSIFIFSLPILWPQVAITFTFTHFITILLPTAHIGLNGSILVTMCLALERFITVCFPFFKIRHRWAARNYIIPVCVMAFVCNISRFFELEVYRYDSDYSMSSFNTSNETDEMEASFEETVVHHLMPTDLRLNAAYVKYYLIWFNMVLFGFLPFISLLVFNLSTYLRLRAMQKEESCGLTAAAGQQREKEIKLSQIGLIIVAVFISCHSVKWVPNIYELHQSGTEEAQFSWPVWIQCTSNVSSLLTTLNGSINVFIYFFKHHEFVIGLIFPSSQHSDSIVSVSNSTRRRRSSWMLLRNPSKPIPLHMSSALPSPSPSRSPSPYASNTCIESNTTSAPTFVDYFPPDQIARVNMTGLDMDSSK